VKKPQMVLRNPKLQHSQKLVSRHSIFPKFKPPLYIISIVENSKKSAL
jgi:hypothetical protein